jgi:hypothetical protein
MVDTQSQQLSGSFFNARRYYVIALGYALLLFSGNFAVELFPADRI